MQSDQIKYLRSRLALQRGSASRVQQTVTECETRLAESKRSRIRYERALEVIKLVGLKTQQQLQFHIGDITSLALDAVFNDPYKLLAEFVERRGKTECDLLFEKQGEQMDPLSASGGGAVDVAAFALRVASWSMQRPKSRNVIILDEPLRFLSEEYQEKASIMIKEISEKLGIQFIIITHEPVLASYADKVFAVSIRNGVSKVV